MRDIEFPAFLVLPVIHQTEEVKMIYHTNWYDGPLDGLLSYMDKQYWYTCVYEDWLPKHTDFESAKRIRWFVLFTPTQEQLEMHNFWHEKFEKDKANGTLDDFYPAYKDVKFPPFDYNQAKYLMVEE
jgi:hypothetical protein